MGGDGIDRVSVMFSQAGGFTLAAGIEHGSIDNAQAGVNLTGNTSANELTGNAQVNTINALEGDDTITGGGGADVIDAGTGIDTVHMGDVRAKFTLERPAEFELQLKHVDTGVVVRVINAEQFDFNGEVFAFSDLIVNTPSPFADQLTGTDDAESINGQAGNDIIDGLGGDDTLLGGAGNDVINGGAGNDSIDGGTETDAMAGGEGDDLYIVNIAADTITEEAGEPGGADTVNVLFTAAGTFNMATNAANVENAVVTAGATIAASVTGNDLSNAITGNAAVNTLIGGAGNDTLDGGVGNDNLQGGLGNDTYIVSGADVLSEVGGDGDDHVSVMFTLAGGFTLVAGIETATIGVALNGVNLTGNASDNRLEGGAGNNSLNGGAGGNDTLIGGGGNDAVDGGAGGTDRLVLADVFENYVITRNATTGAVILDHKTSTEIVSALNMEEFEFSGAVVKSQGEVLLNVISAFDDVWVGGAENDSKDGLAGNDSMDGGAGNDTLLGGAGNDTLVGGEGNDVLNGGTGNDTMTGGDGNDTYTVDVAGDVIVESETGGVDLVNVGLATGTYSMATSAPTVENATVTATTAVNITGNALDNVITGNAVNNILQGNDGADTLLGAAGNDSLVGGNGDDSLDGGLGLDTMVGGAGNDTYVFTQTTDVATEAVDGGTADTVNYQFTATGLVTLGANIEHGAILGTLSGINLTGNLLANDLRGNSGNNILNGGTGGNDTFTGGGGNDTIDGGTGTDSDTLVLPGIAADYAISRPSGTQTVFTRSGQTVTVTNVENVKFDNGTVALSDLTGTIGSTGNETLTSDEDPDMLDGGAGNDTLNAGGGDDTLLGGTGNDSLIGGDGSDLLDGGAGNDTYAFDTATLDEADDYIVQNDTVAASIDTVAITAAVDATVTYTRGDQSYDDLVITITEGVEGAETIRRIVVQNFFDNDAVSTGTIDRVTVGATVMTALQIADEAQVLGDGSGIFVGVQSNDTLPGDEQDNWMLAGAGNDSVTGAAGADTLFGGLGVDTLQGGEGSDLVIGGAGNDQVAGGEGDDSLSGGAGSDTYTFAVGDGNDVISEKLFTGIDAAFDSGIGPVYVAGEGDNPLAADIDVLTMQGISQNAVRATRLGDDLVITVTATGDSVTVTGFFATGVPTIERVSFSDASWTSSTVRGKVLLPSEGADEITGYLGTDRLNGLGGDDTLIGAAGNDFLTGGAGADELVGGTGSDRFILDSADGVDTIVDYGVGSDTIAISISAFGMVGAGAAGSRPAIGVSEHVLYDSATGVLSVDADGAGAGAAVQVALVGTGLTHPDIATVLLIA